MFKILSLIFSVFLILPPVAYSNAMDRPVQVVYIADVETDVEQQESQSLTNRIKLEFSKSSKVKIANMGADFKSNPSESCSLSEDCARREAKAVDADQVLVTNISKEEKLCRVTMSLESIYSKEILKTNYLKSSCYSNDIEDKVVDLLYDMMKTENMVGEREAEFTSNPVGAKVSVNGTLFGRTPFKTKIPLGRAKIWMEISKDVRFVPVLVNEFVESNQMPFKFHKDFEEQQGYLIFNIKPSDAIISINEKKYNNYPFLKIPVKIRETIELTVAAEKYNNESRSIPDLEPGQEYEVNINLRPRPCFLNLTSEPSGASVKIGGKFFGKTPLEIEIPGKKNYEVSLEKEFYLNENWTLECEPDEKIEKSFSLEKARQGYLKVSAVNKIGEDIGAEIYSNGKNTGKTTPAVLEIEADVENTIQLIHSNYFSEEFNIEVAGNETKEKTKSLIYKGETYWRFFFGIGFEGISLEDLEWRYLDPNQTPSDNQDKEAHSNWSLSLGLERELLDRFGVRLMFAYFQDSAGEGESKSYDENLGKPNTLTNPVIDLSGYYYALSTPIYLIKLEPLLPDRKWGVYLSPEVGENFGKLGFKSGYKYKFSQKFLGVNLGLDWNYSSVTSPANFEVGFRKYEDLDETDPSGDDEFMPIKGSSVFHLRASWGVDF